MPTSSRPQRIVGATLAVALLSVGLALPQAASADPAAAPAQSVFTTPGAFSQTVPAGVCAVNAVVLGGGGGSAMATTAVSPNGAGARISATYDVLPGLTFNGSVGAGGQQPAANAEAGGLGGVTTGGAGGTSGAVSGTRHAGAGGGGASFLYLGGSLAVLAGGGGGSAGGHSETTEGVGGNAGIPAIAGVTAGSDGAAGRDFPTTNVVTGGKGGGTNAPGAGGTNSGSAAADGFAGTGVNGGAGGPDSNPDAGGGGGGGFFGAGGGASTVAYNTQTAGAVEISGSGGGGGASYVALNISHGSSLAPVSALSSTAGAKIAAGARGNGAGGSVTLNWIPCDYDLAVAKTVSASSTTIGDTITWTVSVTNLGPEAMTQGDAVTLTDSLPGAGAKTITAISTSGGTNADLARGAITCDAQVGDAMPAALECSRPYDVTNETTTGVRGLDVNETLTISYQQTATGTVGDVLENIAVVTDRTPADTNDSSTVSTTLVADPPVAVNDSDLNNVIGSVVDVNVLPNDSGSIVSASVTLVDPVTGTPITSPFTVPGEGVWDVLAGGVVRFTPEVGFEGDPTPVTYRVTDANGLTDTATVTVTYVPEAKDDEDLGNTLGDTVVVDVLGNDVGAFEPTSVRILEPGTGTPVTTLTVAGQGQWSVNATTGAITFVPAAGYTGNPTPIDYEVTDTTGDTTAATVTVTYLPEAANDVSSGNAEGSPVTVDPIGNDTGNFDPSSVVLLDQTGGRVTTLTVPGEGTWTVNTTSGAITFTPLAGFRGDPTPVEYEITDTNGNTTSALVTITYLHPNAGGLVVTGADAQLPLIAGGTLLLIGIGLVLVASRRRRATV